MVKRKKMLTVYDLYRFCLENNFAKFSAKESGYQLAVQVPTTFEVEDLSDDNHRGMMRLKFRILHDGLNRNKSFVSHNAAVKASTTIADRPILAAIHQLNDGSWDFKSHEMEIIEDENGDKEVNYIEKQVGSFSSEKPFWEHDDELDKDYLCAYGYIAEEYTKAADIIREKGWTKNSCELVIEEMSFNAKEKYLELNAFYLSASTLLGREDDGTEIEEGMLGSRADIADFSVENNSVFSHNDKVIELLSILNEKIDNLNIQQISKEGGKEPSMKKNFEMDSNEAEAEVKETPSAKFDGDDPVVEEPSTEEETTEEESTETDEPVVEDPVVEEPVNNETVSEEGEDVLVTQHDDDDEDTKKTMSVSVSRGDVTKTFAVSLQDKIEALYTLVNDTYAEQDGVWYDCDVYDDEKYVIMHSWWTNDAYKQSYKVKKDVYSLVGDRVPVKAVWCTEDEQKALENMRANYSAIQEELAQFKAEPEKLAIIHSECYEQISDTEAFKKLAERDTYFSMSVEDVRAEADRQLLEYAKHNEIKFADKAEKKSVGVNIFAKPTDKKPTGNTRYGKLFTK